LSLTARARIAQLLVCAAAAAAVLAATAGAGSVRSAARSAYVDGDSLAVGTSGYLGRFLPGWALHEAVGVSRHTYEGLYAVRARGAALERVLVIDLGTNDDPSAVSSFAGYVRDIVRAAGPTRCVIWSTVNRPPYNGVSYAGYNSVLRSLDRRYPTLHVFDWASLAQANPGWFGADGVHPGAAGYRVRAAGIARLVKSC
jgi:lysophospholipase L1-like esterase